MTPSRRLLKVAQQLGTPEGKRVGLHKVWPLEDAADSTTIDVIAIHGLGTQSPRTWVYKKEDGAEVDWLADQTMLPTAVPNARIFTYDWNASYFEDAPVRSLLSHADNLLALANESRPCSKRPIIFIASCFGGLILAEALTRAAQKGNPYRQILLSTAGVVFLATPFQGADAHREAQWQVIVGGIMGERTSDRLVHDLSRKHDFVRQRVQKFAELANADSVRLSIHCFYETKRTEILRRVLPSEWATKLSNGFTHKILVNESSACLQGFSRHALDATHSGMNKFDGPDSPNFKLVKTAIQELADNAWAVVDHRKHDRARLWLVPFERNKNFVGRGSILRRLVEKADPYADTRHTQRIAVEGLGGVGKSQIVIEVLYRIRDMHPDCSVFWVSAVDATNFENSYRDIGRELNVKGIDEDDADAKVLVKDALSKHDSGTWLLVIDNADDIKLLLDKKTSSPLAQYLPSNEKGAILFTTRNHEVAVDLVDSQVEDIIRVEGMSDAEARELLTKGLDDEQMRDERSIASLLNFLANLPLAIKQATAYIAKTGTTITKYLDHCKSSDENAIKLLSRDFEDRGRYNGIKNAVATTLLISFQHIARDNQLAAHYLKFICFLTERGIPASLLPRANNEMEFEEAIGTLKAYAFITQREEHNSFDMHRLVRLAMRNWLNSNGEEQESQQKAVQRLSEVFPFPEHENRNVWTKYLPHAQAVLQSCRKMAHRGVAEADLRHNVANALHIRGKYIQAEELYQQALELKTRTLGSDHRSTLDTRSNLGLVFVSQGKSNEAEVIHQQVFESHQKILGPAHPLTLDSMNNLGLVFFRQGKYNAAERVYQRTLQLKKRILGPEHPSTLGSMSNLGVVFDYQGKYNEAEAIHQQVLALKRRLFGPDHPSILETMNNLGIVFDHQGKHNEAETIHQQVLGRKRRIHGPDHPSTLGTLSNLENVLRHQGKYDEVKQLRKKWQKRKTRTV